MMVSQIHRLARIIGWLAALVVVVASLLPGNLRPDLGFPGDSEHFVAYLGASALLAVGYEKWVKPVFVALFLTCIAGGFELVQYFMASRDADPIDLVEGAAGAFAGAILAQIFLYFVHRVFPERRAQK
jgi:VanZ family protein